MDDQLFRQLLDWFGLSWEGYRKVRKGVQKRISGHMQQLGCRRMDDYLQALEENPERKEQAERLLTVSSSRFFRDRSLWQTLKNQVLPVMIAKDFQKMKVWLAGCACGEEAYSFKIVWDKLRGAFERFPELELWATDMNPEVIDKARQGIYSASSLKELSPEQRSAYFQPADKGLWAIKDPLKEEVQWKVHNLIADNPPQIGFQSIFLRNNLLTYYKRESQIPAFRRVVGSLAPGGVLVIGRREKLPCEANELSALASHPYIFRKKEFAE